MKVPEPRKLSSGNYFIQLRLDGVSVPVTAPTAKECKDTAAYVKAQHRAGKRTIQAKADLTLRQAIDGYIEDKGPVLSPATVRGYRTIQRNRFKPVMDKKIKDIKNWQAVYNAETKLCGAKTLQNAYGLVGSALRKYGYNVPQISQEQVPENESQWLDYEQVLVFVDAVRDKPVELAALLALSSLRRSEICALTADNIDLKHNCINVKGAKVPNEKHQYVVKNTNKNKPSQRTVPILVPRLAELLKDVDEGYLIGVRPDTLRNRINRICKANDLPQVGVHGLRHSFASLAYHVGMPEEECMRIGGWSDAATMRKIYTHLAAKDKAKHENKVMDFFVNANKNANEKIKASIINAYSVD